MSLPSVHAQEARCAKRAGAEAIGIDAAFIDQMVERFYANVRSDAVLGPIFARRIGDWPHHLGRMKAFWGSVLHQSGGYSGNPMLKHVSIPGIGQAEFDRWLDLFGATLIEIQRDPLATAQIAAKAASIAGSLLSAIRFHRDGLRDPSLL